MSRNDDDRQPTSSSSQEGRQEPEQAQAQARARAQVQAPRASGSIPEASAFDSSSSPSPSSSSTSEPKSTLASRRLSARKALRPTSFSWSAPQSLMHPTAPSEHAPLAQREKYFRRINRPDLPFGPAPNRRQRGIALAAYVIATAAAGYMTLFADFGEDEHVFMPIRRMIGLQPPVDAHTKPLRGRRGAPASSSSSSSSSSASSSSFSSNVEQAGTNAAPIANSHAAVDGALGTSSSAPYAGIFSLRKTHSAPSPSRSPSAETGRADAKGQSSTALDRTDALLKEREKELEGMLRRNKEGASGTKSWTDSLVPSSLTAWWRANGSGGRSATDDDTKDASPQTRAKVV